MTSDLMTLRDLRVQTFKERKKGRLTKLPSNFYGRLGELEEQIKKKYFGKVKVQTTYGKKKT